MVRISDPMQIQHPVLRHFAFQAAFLAKLAEAIEELEDLCDDLPAEERYDPVYREGWYEDVDTVAVAMHFIAKSYAESEKAFADRIAGWLAEDPENWPVLRLVLLDPWSDPVYYWHRHAPDWLRVLAGSAERVREKFGPFS